MGSRTLYPLGSMGDQKRPRVRLDRRRRMPLTENGLPEKPKLPFAKREGDLEKVKIGKWVELAEEALHRPPEADQE